VEARGAGEPAVPASPGERLAAISARALVNLLTVEEGSGSDAGEFVGAGAARPAKRKLPTYDALGNQLAAKNSYRRGAYGAQYKGPEPRSRNPVQWIPAAPNSVPGDGLYGAPQEAWAVSQWPPATDAAEAGWYAAAAVAPQAWELDEYAAAAVAPQAWEYEGEEAEEGGADGARPPKRPFLPGGEDGWAPPLPMHAGAGAGAAPEVYAPPKQTRGRPAKDLLHEFTQLY
jgi:hypothetical protein